VPKTLGAEAQKQTNVDFAAQWDNTQLEPAEFLKEELNLEFGKYRLQVQVPERGAIINPFRLVGETISSPYFLIIQNEMSEMISHRSFAIGGMTGKRPTSQSFPLSTTRSVPTSQ
jgi:hypothetical protein